MIFADFPELIKYPEKLAKMYIRFLVSVAESYSEELHPSSFVVLMKSDFTKKQARKFRNTMHEELKPEWN
jgi:hypothetical protein|tara:strand:- start:241 stop:450 length:210 start_codon:yes stop_codon:yes gene_type:complete